MVTVGAYEALYCAINGNIEIGDEVIVIEPAFDCYEPMVHVAGGIIRHIPLRKVCNSLHKVILHFLILYRNYNFYFFFFFYL